MLLLLIVCIVFYCCIFPPKNCSNDNHKQAYASCLPLPSKKLFVNYFLDPFVSLILLIQRNLEYSPLAYMFQTAYGEVVPAWTSIYRPP